MIVVGVVLASPPARQLASALTSTKPESSYAKAKQCNRSRFRNGCLYVRCGDGREERIREIQLLSVDYERPLRRKRQ